MREIEYIIWVEIQSAITTFCAGGGFDTIHGDHAVRLHGRTYHFLTDNQGNAGLNIFTFDN